MFCKLSHKLKLYITNVSIFLPIPEVVQKLNNMFFNAVPIHGLVSDASYWNRKLNCTRPAITPRAHVYHVHVDRHLMSEFNPGDIHKFIKDLVISSDVSWGFSFFISSKGATASLNNLHKTVDLVCLCHWTESTLLSSSIYDYITDLNLWVPSWLCNDAV